METDRGNDMDELPMAPEQQAGAPQQQGQQGRGPFPASRGEALQFSNDVLQVLYDDRTHPGIVKQLQDVPPEALGHGVGVVAGNVVGNRVADVRGQTGRKIEMKLVTDATKAVITELGEIAQGEGLFEMSQADRKNALLTAIDILDRMGSPGRQQGQQGQQGPPEQQGPPNQEVPPNV